MSEHEPPHRGESPSQADRTLLGVAPPKLDSTTESPMRSPVFVRSGTSVADIEPPPVPRMALPSRPPPRLAAETQGVSVAPPALGDRGYGVAWALAVLKLPAQVLGRELALWMVLLPALFAAAMVMILLVALAGSGVKTAPVAVVNGAAPPVDTPATLQLPGKPEKAAAKSLADLEGKALETLSSDELLRLAHGRAEREQEAARLLQRKVEADPALAKDKALQSDLLRFAADPQTAADALATMTRLEAPVGADLLYEVWTGTALRTDTTELARSLVYSTDVRPQASAALAVALDLRVAETCEQYKAVLPRALKDGDRRALHLLTKLTGKRGCGPKKTDDCFACLREQPDELVATINAVKSRRPPVYAAVTPPPTPAGK